MVPFLFLLRQRSEAHKRIKIAKDLGGFARKRSPRGRGGREFAPDDPRQYLFPVLRRGGPTIVLRPFPFHGGVPIAFVTAAQTLLLFRDPNGIRVYARLGDHGESGIFEFATGIDAEARRYRVYC